MLRHRTLLILAIALVPGSVAHGWSLPTVIPNPIASDAPAPETDDPILVTGKKGPYALSHKQLRDAVSAFAEHSPVDAPTANLAFRVRLLKPEATYEGLRVTLYDGKAETEIPVDAEGNFSLPANLQIGKKLQLITNRSRQDISIRPVVLSPGSSLTDLRLGDLRVACEVGWAIFKHDVSFVMRAGIGAPGGLCRSSKIAYMLSMQRPITAANLTTEKEKMPLQIDRGRTSFRVPTYDKTKSSDARVVLDMETPKGAED